MNQQQSVAIIGASSNREKFGNIAVRAYQDQGYTVYPVNPRAETIEGLTCYKSILDIPGAVNIASLYLPPKYTLMVLDDLAAKKVETVFLNPGTEDDKVVERANELGLNIIQACSIIAAGKTPAQYK